MDADLIVVKAKLTLYSFEKEGRQNGIISGYRPNHVFEYKENSKEFVKTYTGQIDFDTKWVYLDQTSTVTVSFLKNQHIKSLIEIDRVWWIHEGQRLVGEAKIIEIL